MQQWDPLQTFVGMLAAALGITLTADLANLSVAVVAATVGASAWLVYDDRKISRTRALVMWGTRICVAVMCGGLVVQIGVKLLGVDLRAIVAPTFGWLAFRGPLETFDMLAGILRRTKGSGNE